MSKATVYAQAYQTYAELRPKNLDAGGITFSVDASGRLCVGCNVGWERYLTPDDVVNLVVWLQDTFGGNQ